MLKVVPDNDNNTVYIKFSEEKIIKTEEIQKGIVLEYNEEGALIGVRIFKEMLDKK
jgi:uncharacterized protein YuzE